jgi:hypothetical protein
MNDNQSQTTSVQDLEAGLSLLISAPVDTVAPSYPEDRGNAPDRAQEPR